MSKNKDTMTKENWKRIKELSKGTNRYSWVSKYPLQPVGNTKKNDKKPTEKKGPAL